MPTFAVAWLVAGVAALGAGLAAIFALWQSFEAPPPNLSPSVSGTTFPDSLPPAAAGAIVARGRPALEHAAAALFTLASRGTIQVHERPRGPFGTRSYALTRTASRHVLARHEEAALDAAFTGESEPTVKLATARARLARRFGRFTRALHEDLDAAGLIDRDRQATRMAYGRLGIGLLVLGMLAFMAWPFLKDDHAGWPLAIPAALACSAVVALILHGTSTPLSNEGVQRARNWSAYKAYLKSLSTAPDASLDPSAPELPYAVAFGLAGDWSKHLEAHPGPAPGWFHSAEDAASGYAAFVAHAGAGAHGRHKAHG